MTVCIAVSFHAVTATPILYGLLPHLLQVRSHAALALGSLPSYTHTQLEWVWPALLGGLEASEHQSDFSEFQQVANLRAQVGCMGMGVYMYVCGMDVWKNEGMGPWC